MHDHAELTATQDLRPAGGDSASSAAPDALELARAAHDGLRDLAEMAAERRNQVVRVLTAIEHQRTGQATSTFQTALELDGMRDELLDLLGRIHDSTDPYAAWAVSAPSPDADAGQDQPVPAHDRRSEGLPLIAVDDGGAPTVVPADAA